MRWLASEKFWVALLFGCLWIGAGAVTCTDIIYSMWGERAEAWVTEERTEWRGGGSTGHRSAVEYQFIDSEGKRCDGRAYFDVGGAQASFEVVYLPGYGTSSKPLSQRSIVAPVCFLLMTGVVVWWVAGRLGLCRKPPFGP